MKTVIITGANGHLGKICAQSFLHKDFRVLGVGRSDDAPAFAKNYPGFSWHKVDLSDEKAVQAFIEDITRQQEIDGALLLAGGFAAGNIQATGAKELRQMNALNFETAYFIARALLPHLQSNGYGRLVFVGARPALQAAQGKNLIAYALSKSLLFRLAEYINEENKGRNVSATVIVPSTIDTIANREAMPDADYNAWVKPENIASILEFIFSEDAGPLRETVLKVYNNA